MQNMFRYVKDTLICVASYDVSAGQELVFNYSPNVAKSSREKKNLALGFMCFCDICNSGIFEEVIKTITLIINDFLLHAY